MNQCSLKLLIRERAQYHGFARCRIARPEISTLHVNALERWVADGMHGEMAWMGEAERMQRRIDPSQILDGVRSVISVAMRYTPPLADVADGSCGRIASYAWGDDYHEIMKKRLKALAAELDQLLGSHDQRVFVDTAPVLEHALAESAGLGWQGKHSLTIDRTMGSWFLLGELFTTAEIEPDEPAGNHCGSCSACIDGCPTGAIVSPYVVDSRRCISYLTIEYDGFIPRDLRLLMGNHIYGCDDCQQLCPWNGHAAGQGKAAADYLNPRGENHLPELASLLRLNEDDFRKRFRKSPIRRTKRKGLLRNVCVAMGNSGRSEFIEPLVAVLDDPEPLIRGHAAWAIGQLAMRIESAARDALIALLEARGRNEEDKDVLKEIIISIENIRS